MTFLLKGVWKLRRYGGSNSKELVPTALTVRDDCCKFFSDRVAGPPHDHDARPKRRSMTSGHGRRRYLESK
jgi:hypothetical protein